MVAARAWGRGRAAFQGVHKACSTFLPEVSLCSLQVTGGENQKQRGEDHGVSHIVSIYPFRLPRPDTDRDMPEPRLLGGAAIFPDGLCIDIIEL